MFGAIYGDIVGSVYEFNNIKTKNFELFSKRSDFTDDTGMTLAVAKTLNEYSTDNTEEFKEHLIDNMHLIGEKYPDLGYGGHFRMWLESKDRSAYNSYGNGSAMRVSPVGFYAKSLEEAESLAKATAEITHNHPEGIKGAVTTAGAIWVALHGASMQDIKEYVSGFYSIDFTLDKIRPYYHFDVSCQGSVPQAFESFFESTGFEDTIRNCISIGGDSDTIAAIAGPVAEAYYGMSEEEKEKALSYLDSYLLKIAKNFEKKFM